MTIIVGARIIDREDSRRGTVMEVGETQASVEWRRRSEPAWCETMALDLLAASRFGVILEVVPGDLVQDIGSAGWSSVRLVSPSRWEPLLRRLVAPPGTARGTRTDLQWSQSAVREPWINMTRDRWQIIEEIPDHSGLPSLDAGDLSRLACANIRRLVAADLAAGRTMPDIAEACWGDGTGNGKTAALATLRRALGKPGNLDKDGHPHWPTERVTRGLVSGLRLTSMAVLFADSE